MDVRSAIGDYLGSLKRLRPLVRRGYAQKLAVFCAWCESAGIELEQVRNKTVDQFLEALKASHRPQKHGLPQLSPYTCQGYVRVIKAFLHWCVEDDEYAEYIKPIVIQRIAMPRAAPTIIEIFDKEQVEALFAACACEKSARLQLRDRAMVAVLLDTGIRAEELCTLTIGHVRLDAQDAYIRVLGKGRKEREVGLGVQSARALARYMRHFRMDAGPADLVFLGRANEQLTTSGLDQIMRRLGAWAHIEGVRCSPHTFRHTFACTYLTQGGNIYMLSRLLGHSSVKVTEIYLRAVKAREARQVSRSVLDNL